MYVSCKCGVPETAHSVHRVRMRGYGPFIAGRADGLRRAGHLPGQPGVPAGGLVLTLAVADAGRYPSLVVTTTDRTHRAERLGRLTLRDGIGQLTLSPRSVTTLVSAGNEPAGPE